MAQRLLHIIAAALFALMVPRLMGPAVFGRYALLTSVSMWFAMLSGLGAVSVMTRAVPPLVMADDMAGLRRLMSSLLALRTVTAVAAASLYFAIIVFLLDESDLVAACFIAGGVFCRTVANVCFSFFLGLNQEMLARVEPRRPRPNIGGRFADRRRVACRERRAEPR